MHAALMPLWIALLFLLYVFAAKWLILRSKAKRQSRPPIHLKLLRLPGETARLKADELLEEMVDQLFYGAVASTILMMGPLVVLVWVPAADVRWLLFSSAVLFLTASVHHLRKVVKIGKKRANYRLGAAGEREVAGHLQVLNAKGYKVFHDVPVTHEKGMENIDHLAVGPHDGLVLIETKTRSISTKENRGNQEVTFDGERLSWPTYPDDLKTVQQVKRCARWVADLVREEFGRTIPVQQIIAIPGWEVVPGKCYNPRVLHPGALEDAFDMMMASQPNVFKPSEIKRLVAKIEILCRDADW
ncbi:MAG: hypothetical protein B7Z37_22435 [Verrucomicrobia bacterium 12-59-8]|nr:MAG: hypothetical protein B7Z37_22435 [Verrucomicrobia bacterium 12-59-8]